MLKKRHFPKTHKIQTNSHLIFPSNQYPLKKHPKKPLIRPQTTAYHPLIQGFQTSQKPPFTISQAINLLIRNYFRARKQIFSLQKSTFSRLSFVNEIHNDILTTRSRFIFIQITENYGKSKKRQNTERINRLSEYKIVILQKINP